MIAFWALLKGLPWRLIGYGAAAAAVLLLAWRINVWHTSHGLLRATQARLELEERCEDGSKCHERVATARAAQATKNAEAATQYEQEIARLNSRPVERRVIRVCPDRSAVRHAAGSGEPAGAVAGGVFPEPDELDTGPLRDLAREADRQIAAYRALYGRDQALAAD